MDSYTNLALDWLATQPDSTSITTDPQAWARGIGDRIFQRTRELTDLLAPSVLGEPFEERTRRLNAAWQRAEEIAIAEQLPSPTAAETSESWTPLVPDLSDLL